MPLIYHITTLSEWNNAVENYEAPSLRSEGFIHCSMAEQVDEVINRYYKDKKDLVRLTIDIGKLKSRLIYEWSQTLQANFPHIYGPINKDAVIEVTKID